MKIVIISKPNHWFTKITKFFTGCHARHIGFLSETGWFYSQDMMFMRERWEGLYYPEEVELFDCPVDVTEEFLTFYILNQGREGRYGFEDYFGFIARAIGWKIKNFTGRICSESFNLILTSRGFDTPFPLSDPPPSPCDWLRYFKKVK